MRLKKLLKRILLTSTTGDAKRDMNYRGGAELGIGCTIFQQVTIGSNTLLDSKGLGVPKLGDEVYIGAGAKIIGNVHIGNRVRIGVNAVVTKDVPDDATVVLEPCRIIVYDASRNNHFMGYRTAIAKAASAGEGKEATWPPPAPFRDKTTRSALLYEWFCILQDPALYLHLRFK